MNKTTANLNQNASEFARTDNYDVGVIRMADLAVIASKNVQKNSVTFNEPFVTIPIPVDLFELDGQPDGEYRGAVRPNNNGGPGSWIIGTAPLDVTWEPTGRDVTFTGGE